MEDAARANTIHQDHRTCYGLQNTMHNACMMEYRCLRPPMVHYLVPLRLSTLLTITATILCDNGMSWHFLKFILFIRLQSLEKICNSLCSSSSKIQPLLRLMKMCIVIPNSKVRRNENAHGNRAVDNHHPLWQRSSACVEWASLRLSTTAPQCGRPMLNFTKTRDINDVLCATV